MKALLIPAALVFSLSLYAQESLPGELMAYTDPPATTDHHDALFDTSLATDFAFLLNTLGITTTATQIPDASFTVPIRRRTSADNLPTAAFATSPDHEDALTNLPKTLDSTHLSNHDYFLKEGGLKLPLSW